MTTPTLDERILQAKRVVILTGAGVSAESGVADESHREEPVKFFPRPLGPLAQPRTLTPSP